MKKVIEVFLVLAILASFVAHPAIVSASTSDRYQPPRGPHIQEKITRIAVDVADKNGRLLRTWRSFIEKYYTRYGWKVVAGPLQKWGRYVVILERISYIVNGLEFLYMPDCAQLTRALGYIPSWCPHPDS